ncbi:glycosyltransferase [Geomonas sp. RF6]|uniref:glycosyltransferase n=1 Tax=Geomonas sp. RF6 TaxID=2897342 RepID=UPI001E2F8B0E|nr:glycosyltransferase [Geomonas sp. RF6]UFS69123.1 glycosyltransferase [Geomonas sp. RF6]
MLFSIIIPAKNEEQNIGRCLASIFATECHADDFEVVVVDNGSSDDTARIAREMGAIVYVVPGWTIGALRNLAASRTTGEILAFIDADCTVSPTWLSDAARHLATPEVVCFGSPPQVPPDATWVQRAWYQVRRKKVSLGETEWLESMNMFVRREAFLACGGFDEKLVTCEDYDLSLRLRALGKLVTDSDVVAFHFGEAATVKHFFHKEYWRGIGNLKGAMRHGVTRSEIPSLLIPVLHALVTITVVVTIMLGDSLPLQLTCGILLLFLLWQSLLLVTSLVKYYQRTPSRAVQIFLLLNVYYLARGLAFLRNS